MSKLFRGAPWSSRSAPSHTIRIWMAGDYSAASRVVRQYCDENGACFAVWPVDYIYTDGGERGFCVSLINYPRFPSEPEEIERRAADLARLLALELEQGSYSIEAPSATTWHTRRGDG